MEMRKVQLPCPDSPNCVNSKSRNPRKFVAPFTYTGRREEARNRLVQILENMDRMFVIHVEDAYVRAEHSSRIFRFKDDVEFFFDSDETVIHIRSASRIGYWDMGANRRRVEYLRKIFNNGGAAECGGIPEDDPA